LELLAVDDENNGFVFDFVTRNFEVVAAEKLIGHR